VEKAAEDVRNVEGGTKWAWDARVSGHHLLMPRRRNRTPRKAFSGRSLAPRNRYAA
jgi:hypothetical protein